MIDPREYTENNIDCDYKLIDVSTQYGFEEYKYFICKIYLKVFKNGIVHVSVVIYVWFKCKFNSI